MSKSKKYFIDAHAIIGNRTGIGNYLYGLLQSLDKKKPSNDSYRLMLQFQHRDNVPNFNSENVRYKNIWFASKKVFSKLQNRNLLPPMDLLFGKGVYIFPNYIRWPLLFSKSVIIVCDTVIVSHPEFVEKNTGRWLDANLRSSIEKSQKVITISKSSQRDIARHYGVPINEIDIVYPAVDHEVFYPRDKVEVSKLRAEYSLFGDYMLFVSTLEPRKNVENLIKAYQKIPKHLSDKYSLVLVGGRGWHDDSIREAIYEARLKGFRVLQPGYVADKDMPALFSGASAFVFPSNYEGFGIPVLEAMACGVPVICSDNSSLPEVAGDAAYYCKTNVASIKQAMEAVLASSSLQKKLAAKSLIQAKKFQWSESADKLSTILTELS